VVDSKTSLAGKVECVYNVNLQETLKEERQQSVNNEGLFKAVRKLMVRGVNREDKWEEKEGLVVGG